MSRSAMYGRRPAYSSDLGLLRARRDRPRHYCAADQRDEIAPLQRIAFHLLPQPGTPGHHTGLTRIMSGPVTIVHGP